MVLWRPYAGTCSAFKPGHVSGFYGAGQFPGMRSYEKWRDLSFLRLYRLPPEILSGFSAFVFYKMNRRMLVVFYIIYYPRR